MRKVFSPFTQLAQTAKQGNELSQPLESFNDASRYIVDACLACRQTRRIISTSAGGLSMRSRQLLAPAWAMVFCHRLPIGRNNHDLYRYGTILRHLHNCLLPGQRLIVEE
jgi:hypothetical protein